MAAIGSLAGVPSDCSLDSRARTLVERLAAEYPGSAAELCALRHDGPFQLLAATILSAQCTDERVNLVTPELFRAFPTPEAMASAPLGAVEEIVRSTGFFRAKARSLVGMAQGVVERFDGEVPPAMDDLTSLPGVGRKTANVLRSVALGLPGLPVDTHVGRLVRRLGLSAHTDPAKVEQEICALVPGAQWGALSLRLILHGRAVCQARTPRCGVCVLVDICPSADLPVRPVGTTGARRKTPKR
ncbi:MAG: endonuclease III [Acidimicrobiales bacterium]